MDCSLCLEAYNLETRRPKLLPCGHTFCQPCLQGNVRCYIENKVFTHLSDILPDDIYLVRLLEKGAPEKERGKLRLWCNGCEAEAVERCLDNGHKLSSMKTYWHRQALEQLQKIKALLEGLIGGQRGEVPAEEYAVCRGGVDVDLTEGADSWTARVQLGGSGEETSPESSVLRLLLREMDAQNRLRSSSAEVGQNNFLAKITLGADENDEEDLLDGLAALDDEDEEEISHENTSADHLPEVRSTMTVSCYDSSTLQELADAPPDLEGLRLFNVRSAQLLAAHRMPALRRLEAKASRWFQPFLLPPLEHDGGLEHVRLCLHPTTTRSLIFAHQRTLRVVEINTLCSISRRDQSRHVWFEDLDYQRCRQMDNVDSVVEGVRRCRYLPIRPPGTFPRLQRIEFVLYKHGKKYTPPWEWIEKMYPGVLVETSIAGERTIPPW